MTREEAIAILEEEAEYLYQDDEPYNRKAFEMAISALEQEPLKNIREEIASHIGGCGFLNDGLDVALEIIDKHIEGR